MKTKVLGIFCFVTLFFLFPITSNAYSTDEMTIDLEDSKQELNLLENKLDTLDIEISSIEKEIELYGSNYQPYKTYQQVVTSTSESTTKELYKTNQNSFINQDTQNEQSDITLIELLNETKNKKDEVEQNISKLNDTIENLNNQIIKLEKIESITFDASDVTKPSGLTVEDVRMILKGTALEDLSQDFIDAEQEYNVNAFFIISICAVESGWGTSRRAVYDNNLTGFGVYSDSSSGINSDTKRGNILLTAKTLHNNYLTQGGSCYNGVSIQSVSIKYCTSDSWTSKITGVGNNLYNKCISYLNNN